MPSLPWNSSPIFISPPFFRVFVRAGAAVSAGIGGRGVIDSRPNDVFGVGYFYNDIYDDRFTTGLGFDGDSSGVEAFYNLAITPAARLSVNLQYLEPSLEDVDDAVVLSGRLHITF